MTIEERNELVEGHLYIVDHVLDLVFGIDQTNSFYEDYQQEGRLALILAADSWDEHRMPFKRYAYIGVVWHLARIWQSVSGIVKISYTMWDKIRSLIREVDSDVTIDEITELTKCSTRTANRIMLALNVTSLDEPISEDDDTTYADMIVDDDADKFIDDIVERLYLERYIRYVISKFHDGWHKEFITQYFSDIMAGCNLTMPEYAAKYSRSPERCRQLVVRAGRAFRIAHMRIH